MKGEYIMAPDSCRQPKEKSREENMVASIAHTLNGFVGHEPFIRFYPQGMEVAMTVTGGYEVTHLLSIQEAGEMIAGIKEDMRSMFASCDEVYKKCQDLHNLPDSID